MSLNLNMSSCLTTPVRAKSAKTLFIDYLVDELIRFLMETLEASWLFPLSELSSAHHKLDIRCFMSHTWLDSFKIHSLYIGEKQKDQLLESSLEASALGYAKPKAYCVYASLDKKGLFVFILRF